MNPNYCDHLVRLLRALGTRRRFLKLVPGLPIGGSVIALLGNETADAQGRRRRRKKRHKHGHHNKKHCKPNSTAKTCAGKCGTVKNNCQQKVNCDACSTIASFRAAAEAIDRGAPTPETATLTWETTNATTCVIDHGVGSVPCNGSIEVGPDATTTFTLSASGPGGASDTASATVAVQYCHTLEAFHAACPSGATQICLSEFISPTSSVDAQAACETCYSTGQCTSVDLCFGRAWSGPSSSGSTQAAYQYDDNGFAGAGDIVGGLDSSLPCSTSGKRWAMGFAESTE